MDGAASIKRPLNGLRNKLGLAWWEAGLLVGLGVAAVVLHQALRLPLELPGRHGIEWMALLVLGRSLSKSKTAGTLTGLGAACASILPVWGALDDPFIWLVYLLPGLVMDLAFAQLPRWKTSIAFLVSLGALAHVTKPLFRWLVNLLTGFPYGSLLWGVFYPAGTHLLFGAIGGLLGALAALGIRKLSDRAASKNPKDAP